MSAKAPSIAMLQIQQQLAPVDPNGRYTIAEAIQRLRTSRRTIYQWIASGELKTITAGGRRILETCQNGTTSKSPLRGRKVASRRWVPGSEIVRLSQVPAGEAA